MRLWLLPGMHGTTEMFEPLLGALPSTFDVTPIGYPTDVPLGYDALLERLAPPGGPFAIVAESFSGPLAIRFAATRPRGLEALVLVSSFARCPVAAPRVAAPLLAPRFFRTPPPPLVVRALMLGPEATDEEVEAVRHRLARVAPEVLAHRLREILRVDVRDAFAHLELPLLYVHGRRDRLVGAGVPRELSKRNPSLRVETLDGPHLLLQRRPAEAAERIARFVLARA